MLEQFFLWGVAMQVANAILEPVLTPIAQEIWKLHPDRVLSPQELADMVVRGVLEQARAADEAAQSGMAGNNFERLVRNTGEPIPLQLALEAWRRGIIPETAGELTGIGPGDEVTHTELPSLEAAIKQSRLKNEYIPVVKGLQWVPLSAAEAIAAWLRGQIPEEEALKRARIAGTAEAEARILYNAAGRPPSPTELVELMRRGYIPKDGVGPNVKSFQQGIYEGDTKDKWWPEFAALAEYLPPPRTIVAMLRAGAISDELAQQLLTKQGLSPELAKSYLAEAHKTKTSTQREATRAQIVSAYVAKVIDRATAKAYLLKLGDTEANAELELATADLRHEQSQLDNAISRARTLFINHKATPEETVKALEFFGLAQATAEHYLAIWTLERRNNVKTLTTAEVAWAYAEGILEEPAALAEIEGQGYSPRDAWVLLWHHSKKKPQGALPAEVAPGDELSPAR